MNRPGRLARLMLAGLLCAGMTVPAARAGAQDGYAFGMIPDTHLTLPPGMVSSVVMLISDAGGWTDALQSRADQLAAKGAAVVGVDLPDYLKTIAAQTDECVYLVSDIEALAHQIERQAKTPAYAAPIIAGAGEGGTLALDIAAQSPDATISSVIAVDPPDGLAMDKVLCSGAPQRQEGDRRIYGLQTGSLPAPIKILLTPDATDSARAHAAELVAAQPDVTLTDVDGPAGDALALALTDDIDAQAGSDQPLGLPLTELPATPQHDTMAVILSGDGGWRDIDMEIGQELQSKGVPVVGLDSLRYFWNERTPEQVAHDLSRILRSYRARWHVQHVLLAGYSFGADVLPRAFNMLPQADRDSVAQLSLLALSTEVDYQVSVEGWLGMSGSGAAGSPVDDMAALPPGLTQCLYGADEEGDPCPDLASKGIEVVRLNGGHHFDADYPALADILLKSLLTRLAR